MSTLNQAFIKAYQRRGIAAPHIPLASPPPPTAGPPSDATAPLPPVIRHRNDHRQAEAVPPAHLKANVAAATAQAGVPRTSVPMPELDSSKTPQSAPFVTATEEMPQTDVTATEEMPQTDLAALSDAVDDGLRPAYEVERFEWPNMVTALLDQSDAELAALVSELLPTGRGGLLVTGCRRGEGRTSVALLLARHLARAGSRVVLVDADFQHPRLAASLATEVEMGWEETLSGTPLGDALIESLTDRLVILPLAGAVSESELAVGGADLKRALARLQVEFDVVCIDGGPLIEAGESCQGLLFGDAPVEAAVVVRDVRHCRLEQSHAVGRKLVQLGASRWAIIENFV